MFNKNVLIAFRRLLQIVAQCSPSVWIQKRVDEWWKSVIPGFTNDQSIEKKRFSTSVTVWSLHWRKQILIIVYMYHFKKRVAVILWNLATNGAYRKVAHLSTACNCVKGFWCSVEEILLAGIIQMSNTEKLKELVLYFRQRWRLPQGLRIIDCSDLPILFPGNTTQNI